MSRRTKILLVCSHLLAVGIGTSGVFLWLGLHAQRVLQDGNGVLTQGALISRYATFLETQRTEAGPAEYRDALKRYLAAVQEAAKSPSPLLDEKTLAFDTALTYERLARVERKMGQTKDADASMRAAVQACGKTGWHDCSPGKIMRISKRLEMAHIDTSAAGNSRQP